MVYGGMMLPLVAGVVAAGAATYVALFMKPSLDPNAKARNKGLEIHEKLAKFGKDVKRDAKVAAQDTATFFKGGYDTKIDAAMQQAHNKINAATSRDVGEIAAARQKADDAINASKAPNPVKKVGVFAVNAGTTIAKDATKAAGAVANAAVTAANDARQVVEHAGNDVAHVGIAVGDLFKHPGQIGHDLAPIADDFKSLWTDIKDVFHPHTAARNQIAKMRQQFDGPRKDRETAIASNVIEADVVARNIPASIVQDVLAGGAIASLAGKMWAYTDAAVNAQVIDKATKDNVQAAQNIYQESDGTLTARAQSMWPQTPDYATMQQKVSTASVAHP